MIRLAAVRLTLILCRKQLDRDFLCLRHRGFTIEAGFLRPKGIALWVPRCTPAMEQPSDCAVFLGSCKQHGIPSGKRADKIEPYSANKTIRHCRVCHKWRI